MAPNATVEKHPVGPARLALTLATLQTAEAVMSIGMFTVPVFAPIAVVDLDVPIDWIGRFSAIVFAGAAIGAASGSAGFGALAGVIGAIVLVEGIAYLVFAWGAWGLKSWAWTLGIILAAVSIVLGLFSLIQGDFSSLISIAIAAAITYYLFQPDVKAAFGRT